MSCNCKNKINKYVDISNCHEPKDWDEAEGIVGISRCNNVGVFKKPEFEMTESDRDKLDKLIIDEEGDKYLNDAGEYTDVSSVNLKPITLVYDNSKADFIIKNIDEVNLIISNVKEDKDTFVRLSEYMGLNIPMTVAYSERELILSYDDVVLDSSLTRAISDSRRLEILIVLNIEKKIPAVVKYDFSLSIDNREILEVNGSGDDALYDDGSYKPTYTKEQVNKLGFVLKGEIFAESERALDAERLLGERIDDEVESLNNRITGEVNTINDKIDSIESGCSVNYSTLEERITDEVSTLNTRIDDEVEDLNNSINNLGEKVDTNYDTLNNRVTSEVESLNSRVDNEVETLNEIIDVLEAKVDSNHGLIHDRMTSEIEILNTRIDDEVEVLINSIETLDVKLDNNFDTLDNRVSSEVATLNSRMDDEIQILNEKIVTEVERIDNSLSILDGDIDEINENAVFYDEDDNIQPRKDFILKNNTKLSGLNNVGNKYNLVHLSNENLSSFGAIELMTDVKSLFRPTVTVNGDVEERSNVIAFVSEVEAVQGNVDNLESSISELERDTDAAFESVNVELNKLDTRVTINEGNIAQNASDILGLRNDFNDENHFKGYFQSDVEIQQIQNVGEGDFAWSAESGTIWIYDGNSWVNSGTPVPDQTVDGSNSNPLMDGLAHAGNSNQYARGDHRHPSDDSKADVVALDEYLKLEGNTQTNKVSGDIWIGSGNRIRVSDSGNSFIVQDVDTRTTVINSNGRGGVNIITPNGTLKYDGEEVAIKANIPTNVSELTNDSGYLTSVALDGYATESYVDGLVGPLAERLTTEVASLNDKIVSDVSGLDAKYKTEVERLDTKIDTEVVTLKDSITGINASLDQINGNAVFYDGDNNIKPIKDVVLGNGNVLFGSNAVGNKYNLVSLTDNITSIGAIELSADIKAIGRPTVTLNGDVNPGANVIAFVSEVDFVQEEVNDLKAIVTDYKSTVDDSFDAFYDDLDELDSRVSTAESDINRNASEIRNLRDSFNNQEHFKGYFQTTIEITQLRDNTIGDFAWSAESGTVWIYEEGGWKNSEVAVPDKSVDAYTGRPLMDGVAEAGSSNQYARGDHRHPSDDSKANVSDLQDYLSLGGNTQSSRLSGDIWLGSDNHIYTSNAGNSYIVHDADTKELVINGNNGIDLTSTTGTVSYNGVEVATFNNIAEVEDKIANINLNDYLSLAGNSVANPFKGDLNFDGHTRHLKNGDVAIGLTDSRFFLEDGYNNHIESGPLGLSVLLDASSRKFTYNGEEIATLKDVNVVGESLEYWSNYIVEVDNRVIANTSNIGTLESDLESLRDDVNKKEHFRGYFQTNAEITVGLTDPKDGDFAWSAESGTVIIHSNGAWIITAIPIPSSPIEASDSLPLVDGTAVSGSSETYARGDHRHPTDHTRQETLFSGTNIKTINGESILGPGNITVASNPIQAKDFELEELGGVWFIMLDEVPSKIVLMTYGRIVLYETDYEQRGSAIYLTNDNIEIDPEERIRMIWF